MRANTLKQKLEAGRPAFGVMLTFPSAPVVEMLGYMGFDWILLDNEHGSITVDTAGRHTCRRADGHRADRPAGREQAGVDRAISRPRRRRRSRRLASPTTSSASR